MVYQPPGKLLTTGSFVFIHPTHAVFIHHKQQDYFTTLAMS